MSSEKESSITAEVDGRLDDLFGDGGGGGDDDVMFGKGENMQDGAAKNIVQKSPPGNKPSPPAQNPGISPAQALISDLKEVVMSLEWEISDQVMETLGNEVDKLKKHFRNNKIVVAFLQLIDSLGKYIQKKKADAHPESITLLNSVYDNLEQVLLSDDLSEAAKKKILVAEVNKYKELKEVLKHEKDVRRPSPPPPPKRKSDEEEDDAEAEKIDLGMPALRPPEPDRNTGGPGVSADTELVRVLQEIHQTIKTEFRALRKDLAKALREQ